MLFVVWALIYGTGVALGSLLLPTKYQLDDGAAENAIIFKAGMAMFVELNTALLFWSAVGRYVVPSFWTFGNTRGLNIDVLVYGTPRLGVR